MPTEQELDATAREAEQTISRTEALIKEAEELLARGEALRQGVTSEKVQKLISGQPADVRSQYEKGIQEIRDEIERDAPKQRAETAPTMRVRPGRQMI